MSVCIHISMQCCAALQAGTHQQSNGVHNTKFHNHFMLDLPVSNKSSDGGKCAQHKHTTSAAKYAVRKMSICLESRKLQARNYNLTAKIRVPCPSLQTSLVSNESY